MELALPEWADYLFEPHRYKVAYGGRGGAKSWSFVRAALTLGRIARERILCCREIQKSIKDSVHKLIAEQVEALGLMDFYTIKEHAIVGRNGTEFIFEGLRHNINSIRSKEGITRALVFEAQNVSRSSWETLIPTIRANGSEIWVEFNPELESDETYQRFVKHPPASAVVRKVNWRDNPWFPPVLQEERATLRQRDEDAYLNIWEGNCRMTLAGAVYAKEMRKMTVEGRIMRVPYDESHPVHTFWDLGWSDCTSILFAQKVGFDYRIIDSFQDRLQKLPYYLKKLQDKEYVYGTHYLPHDGDSESLGAISIKRQLQNAGHKAVVLERVATKKHGLDSVRSIFNRLYVDEGKCSDFIQAIRHYTFEIDEHGQWSKEPLHDENSHYADALQTLGRSINAVKNPAAEIISEVAPTYDREAQAVQWLAT